MKRIFLLFCAFSLITGKIYAQQDSTKKQKKWSREFGLNIYSLNIQGGDYFTNYKKTANNFAFSGLTMKFYRKQNVIRTSFDYLQQITFSIPRLNRYNNLIYSKGVQLAIGYQRMLNKRSTSLFVFTDVSGKYNHELRNIPPLNNRWDYIYYYGETHIYSLTAAVSPGIGIRIKLKNNILLTLESAAQFYYSKENRYLMKGINVKPINACIGFKF